MLTWRYRREKEMARLEEDMGRKVVLRGTGEDDDDDTDDAALDDDEDSDHASRSTDELYDDE